MKTSPACLLAALFFHGLLHADDRTALEVSAVPARATLPAGSDWTAVKYRFTNLTTQDFEVVERTAFFHSLENEWQSKIIGPIATKLKLPAGQQAEWPDRVLVSRAMVTQATAAHGLENHELLLVQEFTLVAPDGTRTRVATTLVVHVDPADVATEHLESKHYDITVLSALQRDEDRKKQLGTLLDFADAGYEKLTELLGFEPHPGKKVPLRLDTYGGSPYYQSADGGYLNIPCDVAADAGGAGWVFVAYPHELTHYFLLEEFPHPPRWFIEGPASFFGDQVAAALGHEKIAAEDREKIRGWVQGYAAKGEQYLFTEHWPEDGKNDNPGDGHSYGMGMAYEICVKLEAQCGPEFFRNVFRHLRENQVSFGAAKNEAERNEILIAAMQTQTDQDVWELFAAAGFRP